MECGKLAIIVAMNHFGKGWVCARMKKMVKLYKVTLDGILCVKMKNGVGWRPLNIILLVKNV